MAKKEESTKPVEEKQDQATDQVKAKSDQAKTKPTADDQVTILKAQIEKLQADVSTKDDQYLRAEAEIQNMTKRFNKERESLLKYDGQDLVKGILPVLDNLKRALQIEVSDDAGKQLKKGIQMVHDHLEQALKEHGVTEIEALNKPFDPQTSQAVQTVPVEDGQKPETVVKVLQAGYMLKDRVMRPAMVIFAQ